MKSKLINRFILVVSGFSLLIIGITLYAYYKNDFFNFNYYLNTEKLGNFGDFIGGLLGVLLTIIATILIYQTYHSQREELRLNRELFEQQRFENTFFNLLKVHQELKNGISFNSNNMIVKEKNQYDMMIGAKVLGDPFEIKGRDFFNYAAKDLKLLFHHHNLDEINPDYIISKEVNEELRRNNINFLSQEKSTKDYLFIIKIKYNIFFKNYKIHLGDYFRNLYHILNFINTNKKSEISRNNQSIDLINKKYKQYSDILQSQMSISELLLIYYNAFKFRKLRKLLFEFDLVENLYTANLLDEYHKNFKCFGKIKIE